MGGGGAGWGVRVRVGGEGEGEGEALGPRQGCSSPPLLGPSIQSCLLPPAPPPPTPTPTHTTHKGRLCTPC